MGCTSFHHYRVCCVSQTDLEAEDLRMEVECLERLQPHKHIVELKDTFEDEEVRGRMLCDGHDMLPGLAGIGMV